MKKAIGKAFIVFTGLLALLTGCPTNTTSEDSGDYINMALVIDEKRKYATAVEVYLDESDASTDVTDQILQLKPGKIADRTVNVSILDIKGKGLFTLIGGGKMVFNGMPVEEDFVKDDGSYGSKPGDEIFQRTGLFNVEVMTLLFERNGETTTLDTLVVVNRKGEPSAPERIAVVEGDTFVLYGYDVINSAYINRSDVKITHPILDVDKVNAADMVRRPNSTESTWETAAGESIKELIENLNVTASAEYKGVAFSGKVEAEFATSHESKVTTRYAKGRGFHITQDEFLRNASSSILKDLLDDTFKADVMTKSASYILDTYGTHLISRCWWGGSAEFNYSYTGSELKDSTQIKAALNATYASFSGSAGTSYSQQANELKNNSYFQSSSRGGNNTSFINSDQFVAGYGSWVNTVKDKPDLCGIPNLNENLIPIWNIVKEIDASKAEQIRSEFISRVDTRGIALEGFKYTPPEPVYSYVTAINVTEQQHGGVPYGYNNIVKSDMYNPNAGALDANEGAGGAWIRIPYKTDTGNNNHKAIAELRVVDTGKSGTLPWESDWETISFDLNKGSGGPYLWLQYRRVNPNDQWAIDFIGSYSGESNPSWQILPGYSWEPSGTDLNRGVSGKYIYLTVHKSPFTW